VKQVVDFEDCDRVRRYNYDSVGDRGARRMQCSELVQWADTSHGLVQCTHFWNAVCAMLDQCRQTLFRMLSVILGLSLICLPVLCCSAVEFPFR